MRETSARAAEDLFRAAQREAGFTLLVRGAYRSFEEQRHLYDHKLQRYGLDSIIDWVAYPGHSEHQTGLALDVATAAGPPFARTLESQWLAENAHRFGFIIRYPQGWEEETGVMFEPWHIRYVGISAATEIYENGWILEEFLRHHTR
jgi:LAS superfamily LD-carboxypeptidase LdcB